jgi:nucleoredoxin
MKPVTLSLCLVLASPAFAAPFASTLKGDLVALKGKRAARFDDAQLANTKYFALYYSASWCGPCKAFTPKLVEWYNTNKPRHPEFELILVSSDTDENSMEAYMAGDKMPWPALKFSKIKSAKNIQELAGKGIPCLVFLDADGKVLSHSYDGTNYVGPSKVLADIERTLGPGIEPAPAAAPSTGATTKPAGSSSFDDFFKKKP